MENKINYTKEEVLRVVEPWYIDERHNVSLEEIYEYVVTNIQPDLGRTVTEDIQDIEPYVKDRKLKDVIKYLNTLNPDDELFMNWTGYEDCTLCVSHTRLETDEEYGRRLAKYFNDARCKISKKRYEVEIRQKRIKELQEELKSLME